MPYWSKTFDGLPEHVSEVREYTRKLLGDSEVADAVELVVSELAGNAVRHSDSGEPGGQFTVHLAAFRDRWQVRVDDEGGPSVPHVREPMPIECIEDLDALGEDVEVGRGLTLVAGLSSAWGVLGDQSGRAVWVEILISGKGQRDCLQVSGGQRVVPGATAVPQRQDARVDSAGARQTVCTRSQRQAAGKSWAQSGRRSESPSLVGSIIPWDWERR